MFNGLTIIGDNCGPEVIAEAIKVDIILLLEIFS